jgi:hypothetical protein
MRSAFQPLAAGLSENAKPGRDGAMTWNASLCLAAVRGGIGQGIDHLEELDHRAGPAGVMRIGMAFAC